MPSHHYQKEVKKILNEDLGRLSADEFAAARKLPVTVVLDNVRSMNNVGSLFRTCDGFAMERVVLCGITATPPNKEIHKTALGAELTVPWSHYPTTHQALADLLFEGYHLIAIEQVEGATMLDSFVPQRGVKYALVLGNEVFGVEQQAIDLCHQAIEIPQLGTKHSLNVSVSAGVVLWHFFAALK